MEKHLEKEHHFHDAAKHGIVYRFLNELLHLIVLVYTLYGLIRFDVKFIHSKKLVKYITKAIVLHSWYLSIKFSFIAFVGYFFNLEISMRNLSLDQFNCLLSNHSDAFRNTSIQGDDHFTHVMQNFESMFSGFSPIPWNYLMAVLNDMIGGPYRVLGNRATLMYGFYATALYIMLAIFPLELMSLKVAFNYTRFVLNDTTCMGEFLDNKQDYLDAISKWSRVKSESHFTHCVNTTASQRDLRCRYVTDALTGKPSILFNIWSNNKSMDGRFSSKVHRMKQSLYRPLSLTFRSNESGENDPTKHAVLNVDRYLNAPSKSLLHHMAFRHNSEFDYNVKVANKNLMNFIPYVRSQAWFKYSMKLYPIFIFLFFTKVIAVIALISNYFRGALRDISQDCMQKSHVNLADNWSLTDYLLYYESDYQVFALSCAASFYSSYYFGTILELNIWMQELSQQLDLCTRVVTITNDALRSHYTSDNQIGTTDWFHYREHMQHLFQRLNYLDEDISNSLCNEFGGIKSLEYLHRYKCAPLSVRNRMREIMAVNLLDRKQTLLRATYVNTQLFLSEHKATRFMTRLILGRTTRLALAFAAFASLTRSQLVASYMNLTFLLAVCLAILNMYLIGAASINTCVSIG